MHYVFYNLLRFFFIHFPDILKSIFVGFFEPFKFLLELFKLLSEFLKLRSQQRVLFLKLCKFFFVGSFYLTHNIFKAELSFS